MSDSDANEAAAAAAEAFVFGYPLVSVTWSTSRPVKPRRPTPSGRFRCTTTASSSSTTRSTATPSATATTLAVKGDGSLHTWIQHDSPGTERESNWAASPGRLVQRHPQDLLPDAGGPRRHLDTASRAAAQLTRTSKHLMADRDHGRRSAVSASCRSPATPCA
jgi:hypothetical protein